MLAARTRVSQHSKVDARHRLSTGAPGRLGSDMRGVDLACLVPAAGLGLMESWPRLRPEADALDLVDLLAGGAGCLALLLRRRWPAPLALILSALSAVVVSIGGAAALVATFSVAIRWPKPTSAPGSSRPGGWNATGWPARCTTCSPTGCRCSAMTATTFPHDQPDDLSHPPERAHQRPQTRPGTADHRRPQRQSGNGSHTGDTPSHRPG